MHLPIIGIITPAGSSLRLFDFVKVAVDLLCFFFHFLELINNMLHCFFRRTQSGPFGKTLPFRTWINPLHFCSWEFIALVLTSFGTFVYSWFIWYLCVLMDRPVRLLPGPNHPIKASPLARHRCIVRNEENIPELIVVIIMFPFHHSYFDKSWSISILHSLVGRGCYLLCILHSNWSSRKRFEIEWIVPHRNDPSVEGPSWNRSASSRYRVIGERGTMTS